MKADDREKASQIIGELKKKHPCVCTVGECPFKGTCCICIRNHLEDGTLPACCLPSVTERYQIDKYPDCRTPLLWFLISPETFKDMFYKLSDELREKIKSGLARLYFTAREL